MSDREALSDQGSSRDERCRNIVFGSRCCLTEGHTAACVIHDFGDEPMDYTPMASQAEVARLRTALEELHAAGIALAPLVPPVKASVSIRWDEAMDGAREALNGGEDR